MAAQVEVQTGEVGRTGAAGRLHLSPRTDSSNKNVMEMPSVSEPHIMASESSKPAPSPKPRLTPKPFAVEKNPTIKPILAPKPQTKPRPETTRLTGPKPDLPNIPKPTVRQTTSNPSRPTATSFRAPNKLKTGQTTKPVPQPFKPAPPLDPGEPSRSGRPVPTGRQKPAASSLAYSKSLKMYSAAEWSGTTSNKPDSGPISEGSITRAKSMDFLAAIGQDKEEKEKVQLGAAVQMRTKPRTPRPRPVSAIFPAAPAKTEAPAPAPRSAARRPLSVDLTSKFEFIGLPRNSPKANTPTEPVAPLASLDPEDRTTPNAPVHSTDGPAEPANTDQDSRKLEDSAVKEAEEVKPATSIRSRISLLLDSSSSPGATADPPSSVQSLPESEPLVGVKQLIKQLTEDTTPPPVPAVKPVLKPRPLPLDLTKRFSSERSPEPASLTEAADRHEISRDPQRGVEESKSSPSVQKMFANLKDSPSESREVFISEGWEAGQLLTPSKESGSGAEFHTVRASLFENVVERQSVLMMDQDGAASSPRDHPAGTRRHDDDDDGSLVTATYREPSSPSDPFWVSHAFDTVQAAEHSQAMSESVPAAQWEDKAMTLRSRRSERSRPGLPMTPPAPADPPPRYLRVGALQRWTDTGLDQRGGPDRGMLEEWESEGRVALERDQDEVAAASKRLKMLQAEEQQKPRATYFALTGQMQEISPGGATAVEGAQLLNEPSVRSSLSSFPARRNPSLELAFEQEKFDELMLRSHVQSVAVRSPTDKAAKEETAKKQEHEKETERHRAKVNQQVQADFEKMRELDRQREYERQRQKAFEKEKRELEEEQQRQKQLELEKQKLQELERQRERREVERQKEMEAEKSRQMALEQEMLRMKELEKRTKLKEMELEKQRQREKERMQEMERQQLENERLRREQEQDRKRKEEQDRKMKEEQERLREMERQQIVELEKQRSRERAEKEAEKLRQMVLEQEMLKMKELEKERAKQREIEMERQMEIRMEKERELEKQRQRQLDMERQQLEKERLRREQEQDRKRKEEQDRKRKEEQERFQEMERQQIVELEKQRSRERAEKEAEKLRQMALEQEMLKIKELEKERAKEREMERQMEIRMEKERELEKQRQRQLDLERQQLEKERLRREQEQDRKRKEEQEKLKEMERQQIVELEKQRLREKEEKEAEKLRQMALEQEMLKIKELEKERAKQREMEMREQEKRRQREMERQRQLDLERQQFENERLRREQERDRQRKEQERLREMELEKRKAKEKLEKAEAEKMRHIAKQQEAERQRLKEKQKKEEEERLRLESSHQRHRGDPASSQSGDPSPRWREPHKPAVLNIDSFTSPTPPGFPAPDAWLQPTPGRDGSWKVPPQTSSPIWTTSPQDPWELRPIEMSVDGPRNAPNTLSPEQPQRHRPAFLDQPLLLAPPSGKEPQSYQEPPHGGDQAWIPREPHPPKDRNRRRTQGSQELSRMRSRSMCRRSAPASSTAEGSLFRMRSRSAHREQDLPGLVQQKQSGESDRRDSGTPVRDADSQYGTWDTGLRTDDSLTPASPSSESTPSASPRKPTPLPSPGPQASAPDGPSSSSEVQPLDFPDAPTVLLDNSALRSRAQLGKKRAPRTRPSKAPPAQVDRGKPEDWLYRDSTEAKAESRNYDSESEEPSKGADGATVLPQQPQRVALFPGMDTSALKAQLKKRGDSDNQTNGPAPPPSHPARSPRSPFLPRAARVLPPAGGKENGEEDSPQWLKELKSKKRLSHYESES